MLRLSSNIYSNIFFRDEVDNLDITGLHTVLSAPTAFTGQRLSGSLVVRHYGIQEHVFDTVQCLLRGEVKSKVKRTGSIVRNIKQPLIWMSCIKLAADFERVRLEDSLTTAYKTDFFFEIPEYIMLPSDDECLPHKLPPSIRVVKSALHAVGGTCDVVYYIEARVLRRMHLVSHASREIIIIPTAEIPPPLEPGDLKKEFQLTATSSFGSFWNPAKSVTVVASSSEPRPLIFPTNKGNYGSTELHLNFKMRSILGDDGQITGPQLTACEVMITPEAVTYFLEHEQESVMSTAEALQSPVTVLKRTTFKTKKRNVRLTEWRKGRVINSDAAAPIFEAVTSVSLPVILPEDFSHLPSFFSPLVARRYAFNLQILLGPKYSITVRKPITLRIPVQIVHAPVPKSATVLSEFVCDDLDVPPYVV